MQQHAQPLVTSNEFGESDYGKRLDYESPKYRDPIFAILYIVHVLVVLAAGIYIWAVVAPDVDNTTTPAPYQTPAPTTDVDWSGFNAGGFVGGIFATMLVGTCFGICWLQVMKKFADVIIKSMLFFNIGIWVIVGIIGIAASLIPLAIIGFILAAFYGLYTWCIWGRIPFASALLSISSAIISKYQGTICLSLSVILFNILWFIVWVSCASAYTYTADQNGNMSNLVIFLLLVSMYWGFQVNKNISHTTTCGVCATWYFSTVVDHKPTPRAFKRTMTTSFGSVCLGSLIVAFLQAVRAMLRGSKNSRSCLTLLALCLLRCVENLIRYFNKYAFAQCAIYGSSFIQSAKATWNLFMTRGILAIINDDLTGMALTCGALIGAVVSGAAGYGIGWAAYHDDDSFYPGIAILLAILGFFIGLVFCSCVLMVIASCVICLFVCYSEDPAAMNQNRPQEYNRVVAAKPSWGDVYRTYGGAAVAPVMGPTVTVQQQQPVVVAAPPQTQGQVVYVQPQQQQQVIYAVPQQQQQQQQPVVYAQPPRDGPNTSNGV